MVAWIPDDPNRHLHAIHFGGSYPAPVDWEIEYAGYQHSYAPDFRRLANQALGGVSCAQACRALAPFAPIAIAIIPSNLKLSAPPVQPTDWTHLPNDQIRRIWDRKNVVFSKTVLAKTALQLALMEKDGQLGKVKLNDDGAIADADKIIERARAAELETDASLFADGYVQLAAYRFTAHKEAEWSAVFSDADNTTKFKAYTGQHKKKFIETFTGGKLATVKSLEVITQWISAENINGVNPGQIGYVHKDDERVTAAKKENVREI